MKRCLVCKKEAVNEILNFGRQPVCNRYLVRRNDLKKEFRFPLTLGQCSGCGLVQLVKLFPLYSILPKYDWVVRYAEPEAHLDELAETIANLKGLTKDALIFGISFKDDSLLSRLQRKGFRQTRRLIIGKDLKIRRKKYGVETVQDVFTIKTAKKLVKIFGKQRVIIARHILEHVYNPGEFMKACRYLLEDGGYLVFEVPGNDQALGLCDYTIVWEEHTMYFTRFSFQQFFRQYGARLLHFQEVAYPLESSLIGIVRLKEKTRNISPNKVPAREIKKVHRYGSLFEKQKKRVKDFLTKQNGVALFGAGHLACGYVNFFDISKTVKFFVDDDTHKKNMYMAKSGLPIYQSDMLLHKKIQMCLLSLNPRNEDRIIESNKEFIKKGGKFFSIFPSSAHALTLYV